MDETFVWVGLDISVFSRGDGVSVVSPLKLSSPIDNIARPPTQSRSSSSRDHDLDPR